MDTLLAIGRRAVRGRPLFQPDKEHIHHKLMDLGLSHRQAVFVLYGFCILLGTAALILTYANSGQSALLLLVVAIVAFVFLRSLGYVRLDRMPESALDRKRNRAVRSALQPLGRRLRQLRAPDEMWPLVVEAAGILGAIAVTWQIDLTISKEASEPVTFNHGSAAGDDAAAALFRFRFNVPGAKADARSLELGWADGRQEVDRDTEIAVEIFCEHLGEALDLARNTRLTRAVAPRS
jgi:UDP-GlcNAc:undecaprenyl-phosphate GlcNAc-1-phosphate transferase